MVDVTPDDLAMATDVARLMRMLRPGLGEAEFHAFAVEAHGQGLVFTAAYDAEGSCAGVATYRIIATSRGRLLFVDDLVTDPAVRSTGVGRLLLADLAGRARAAGCVRIELDTGTANHGAQRFYHTRGMTFAALHFTLDV